MAESVAATSATPLDTTKVPSSEGTIFPLHSIGPISPQLVVKDDFSKPKDHTVLGQRLIIAGAALIPIPFLSAFAFRDTSKSIDTGAITGFSLGFVATGALVVAGVMLVAFSPESTMTRQGLAVELKPAHGSFKVSADHNGFKLMF